MTNVGIYGALVIFGDVIYARAPSPDERVSAQIWAASRRGKAQPGFRGTDRATRTFATSSMMNEVIYGSASNRKVRAINKLLIDDQRRHLWRARHLWRRHLCAGP
jgi:hypothetical protein